MNDAIAGSDSPMKLDYHVPKPRGEDHLDAVVAAWVGAVLGIFLAVPLILIGILSMADRAIFVRIAFPFPFLLAFRITDLSPVAFGVALLQWPLLGALVGWLLSGRRYWVIGMVGAVHALGIWMCFRI